MGQSLIKNYVHIIYSTKQRQPFIHAPVEAELHSYLGGICRNLECTPVKIGGYTDHVHILCLVSKKIPLMKLLEELKAGGNHVIGYVGGLHRFVDQDLIAEMARMRPNWKWVFVGSIQTPVNRISSLENVYLLGQRPHNDLAYYLGKFSACIIPYINAVETATVVPVKLKEYLAAEKPVVESVPVVPAASDLGFEPLAGPRGVADDLKKLHHMSPAIEKKLNDLGLFHYWQIAAFNAEAAHNVGEEVGLPGRVDGWVAQAKALSAETE